MANPNIEAQQIMAAFGRYVVSRDGSEINQYTLKQLRSADEQIGARDLNEGFRIAMRNRIKETEGESANHHGWVRDIVMVVIGAVAGGIAAVAAGIATKYLG